MKKILARFVAFILAATLAQPAGADGASDDGTGVCIGPVLMPYIPRVIVPAGSDSGYVDDLGAQDRGWFHFLDGPNADGSYLYDMAGSTINGLCLGRGPPSPKHP
jgi:hypothetical protein